MGARITDEPLWRRSLDGDGDAFAALFARHRDRVYRHAYHLTGALHDAEDVTATAFLELWRRREAVRLVDGSVLAWLLVTTTNTARNLTRKTVRHRNLLRLLPRAEPVSGVDEQHQDDSLVASLEPGLLAALRRLAPRDLSLLVLVTYEGLSVAEAASELGLTAVAARSRLHRARERIRRHAGVKKSRDVTIGLEGTTP